MPLSRWNNPVCSVIWKQKVALQSDAAITAQFLVLCMSPLSIECSYHTSGDGQALHHETGEADTSLLVVGEQVLG